MEKKSVTSPLRSDYRKWLQYFLYFWGKYLLPDSRSENVRLFIKKLKSKNRLQKNLDQAAYASGHDHDQDEACEHQ